MNVVHLFGRLVRDPEMRYLDNGTAMTTITIAVDKKMTKERKAQAEATGQPTADFLRCIAWGKSAENIMNYFVKGQQILISGRIQTGSYDKPDGTKVYTTDIMIESFYFVGSAKDNQALRDNRYQQHSQGGNTGPTWDKSHQNNNSGGGSEDVSEYFYPISDDDIPF